MKTQASSLRSLFPSYRNFVGVKWKIYLCEALADLCEDGLVLDVVFVVCLEFSGDSVQGALEGVFGGGVDHLGLLGWSALLSRLVGRETNLNSGIIW